MIASQIINEIKSLEEKGRVTNDSRLTPVEILNKVNTYRAIHIARKYEMNGEIDPVWVLPTGNINVSKILSNDDASMTYLLDYFSMQTITVNDEFESNKYIGKAILPEVVSLPKEAGYIRIAKSSNQQILYRTTEAELWRMVQTNDVRLKKYVFYWTKGQFLYVYPYFPVINATIIPADPMQIYLIDNRFMDNYNLIPGNTYIVHSGQITYRGVVYSKGNSFTVSLNYDNLNDLVFSGGGRVKLYEQKRKRTINDFYPIDRDTLNKCIMSIMTIDYRIEAEKMAEVLDNSKANVEEISNQQR